MKVAEVDIADLGLHLNAKVPLNLDPFSFTLAKCVFCKSKGSVAFDKTATSFYHTSRHRVLFKTVSMY